METVAFIIIIVLSLVFKVVEKKLQNAGKPANNGGVRPQRPRPAVPPVSPKPFVEHEARMPEPVSVKELTETSAYKAPVAAALEGERTIYGRRIRNSVKEEQKQKTGPDPKKLIVYSEIMKPKYTEI